MKQPKQLKSKKNKQRIIIVVAIAVILYFMCAFQGCGDAANCNHWVLWDIGFGPDNCCGVNGTNGGGLNIVGGGTSGCGTCPGGGHCDCPAPTGGSDCPDCPEPCGLEYGVCGGACRDGSTCMSYPDGFTEFFGLPDWMGCGCVPDEYVETGCYCEQTKYGLICSGYCSDGETSCEEFNDEEQNLVCGCRGDPDSYVPYLELL